MATRAMPSRPMTPVVGAAGGGGAGGGGAGGGINEGGGNTRVVARPRRPRTSARRPSSRRRSSPSWRSPRTAPPRTAPPRSSRRTRALGRPASSIPAILNAYDGLYQRIGVQLAAVAAAGASDEYSPAGVAELRRVGSEGVWRAWLLAPVMPLAVLAAQLREEAMGTRADTVSRWVAGAKLPARERACLYVALVVIDCFAA